MDNTQDPRFAQLQKELGTELELNKDIFSARGFGRSTDTMQALTDIGKVFDTRIATLNSIVNLEAQLKTATGDQAKALGQALATLNSQYAQQAQDAQTRRTGLIQTGDKINAQNQSNIKGVQVPRGIKIAVKTLKSPVPQQPTRSTFSPIKSLSTIFTSQKRMFSKPITPTRKVFHL